MRLNKKLGGGGKNVALLIDFGYLEKVAKKLTGLEKEDYNLQTLAINLCKKKGLWCEDIYFYYAPPYQSNKPSVEQIERKRLYDLYINKISKLIPPVTIREGRLQKKNDGYTQKGVDTLLTYDLLRLVQTKRYCAVILITADTDFAPIKKNLDADYPTSRVILAYYTDRKRKSSFSLSNHLWKVFSEKILIIGNDFFIGK